MKNLMDTNIRSINNYSNINNSLINIIDSILLSVDGYNLIFETFNCENTNEYYYLINFNNSLKFENLLNLIRTLITDDIEFYSTIPCEDYYLINFKKNEEIVLVIHLYSMCIFDYCKKFTEPFFDCNIIYRSYTGYNSMYNYHYKINIPYDDVLKRKYNKKFSYIFDDLKNLDKYLETFNSSLVNLSHADILNKLNYSLKLIENGWIMDEYLLKSNTWTINYWKNYKSYSNIIKFNNNNNLNNKCKNCNKCFNNEDIVFNKDKLYLHYNCLFELLTIF